MKDIYDLSRLTELVDRIKDDPKGDYDDALFHTLVSYLVNGKACHITNETINDHGKTYIVIDGKRSDRNMLSFEELFECFFLPSATGSGFVYNGITIEKGFIEEILSAASNPDISIILGNGEDVECDAIVAAEENRERLFTLAGDELKNEWLSTPTEDRGEAWLAGGYSLKSDRVIFIEGKANSRAEIESAYRSILRTAGESNIRSVALPFIVGELTVEDAVKLAIETVIGYFDEDETTAVHVTLCAYSEELFNAALSVDV